jgi:glycosyltransferase involved in cell wall biosynthesis
LKRVYFTVTNDLSFDQRMQRICTSLANAGFEVILVGRRLKKSIPLHKKIYRETRLACIFDKGFLFYAEYNIRLFFFLLFKRMDGVCAIDLDTIMACLLVSKIKNLVRIYDAHEFFTEMKEVRTRSFVKKFWTAVERTSVPQFKYGYTVSESLANEFKKQYKRDYLTIRNLPVLRQLDAVTEDKKFLLAQGAVNEGRAFEWLIPAMRGVPYKLVVCGDGNFMPQLKELIRENKLEDKIELKGMLLPADLWPITQAATLGLGLAEKEGVHQFLALPNKFFDYIHAGLPQLAMAYPEYEKINTEFRVAVLIDELSIPKITEAINEIMENGALLKILRDNCLRAREKYCWQNEEKLLIDYYRKIFRIE